jgi:hypothetical protein
MLDKGARDCRTVGLKKRYFWLAMNLIEVEGILRRVTTLPTNSIPGERPCGELNLNRDSATYQIPNEGGIQ